MSDTLTEEQIHQQSDAELSDSLRSAAFGDSPNQNNAPNAEIKPEIKPEEKPEEEEVIDGMEWIKQNFGVDSPDVLKQEIQEGKVARETLAKGYQYKDDNAKKIAEYINEGKTDELYNYLDTQKKLDKLLKADLSDKNAAAELVKFGLQKDNPTLSPDDVDFLFNQKYSIPSKPVKGDVEEEADYEARVDNWKNQVSAIERGLIIEAKMNQPKMAQFKTELTLPQIQRQPQQPAQPTQEELQVAKELRDAFVQTAEKTIEGFNGFSAQVKDKDVDYSVAYAPSKEEKEFISNSIKQFAESNFDANALFAHRWVNQDGKTLNVTQMVKDLSLLQGGDASMQKIANDAANKRIEAYLKDKKQINVNLTNTYQNFTPEEQKNQSTKLADAIFA